MADNPRLVVGFRARGYTDEDRSALVRHLESVATVELQPVPLPEAGGSAELWAAIDFAGLAVASGIIGNVATDAVKAICRQLATWWGEHAAKHQLLPEIMSVRVVFGDLTIEVADVTHDFSPDAYFMSGPGLELIPAAIGAVLSQLPPGLLAAEDIRYVRVDVDSAQSESPFAIARYWRLGISADEATHLYDSWYGTVGQLPTRTLRNLPAGAESYP